MFVVVLQWLVEQRWILKLFVAVAVSVVYVDFDSCVERVLLVAMLVVVVVDSTAAVVVALGDSIVVVVPVDDLVVGRRVVGLLLCDCHAV